MRYTVAHHPQYNRGYIGAPTRREHHLPVSETQCHQVAVIRKVDKALTGPLGIGKDSGNNDAAGPITLLLRPEMGTDRAGNLDCMAKANRGDSMRHWQLSVTAAFYMIAYCVPSRAAVTEDTFVLRSTSDLVALCTAAPSDAMGTASLNFCQGFGVGVFRVLQEVESARKMHTFCMPKPMPTRNEALASFVQWARTNPDELNTPPQDGILAFLVKQYPCARRK
jgi:hypothetical protein